jgi:hypothetical protein
LGQKNIDGGGHVQPHAFQNVIRVGFQLACCADVNVGVHNTTSYLIIILPHCTHNVKKNMGCSKKMLYHKLVYDIAGMLQIFFVYCCLSH